MKDTPRDFGQSGHTEVAYLHHHPWGDLAFLGPRFSPQHFTTRNRGAHRIGLSAVQLQTSLNGERTEFRRHSTSFTTLVEALRYLDEFCVKVLKYYLDKSKVDALTACFNHTSRHLQANPISPRLTTEESEHPYVSAIT